MGVVRVRINDVNFSQEGNIFNVTVYRRLDDGSEEELLTNSYNFGFPTEDEVYGILKNIIEEALLVEAAKQQSEELIKTSQEQFINRDFSIHDLNKKIQENLAPLTMNVVKNLRSSFLNMTDWMILPDSPIEDSCKEEIKKFRQELRDLPSKYSNPNEVVWPEPPACIDDSFKHEYVVNIKRLKGEVLQS